IDHTLAILMEGHFIDGKRQALKTLPEIQTELKVKKLVDKIDIPKTDQIDDFILKYIKTREGKSFSGALRQDRHRQKTK
ncbi:MAG: hypothetical protein LBG26_08600, partial [Treponema sp.]|nr:hypothetical protein [Treponema sp.]